MSYDEARPPFFSERSYFDSAEGVWIDQDAEQIPFGAEAVPVSYEGIAEELAERASRDAAKGKPRDEPAQRPEHTWHALDLVSLGEATPEPPGISGLFYPGRRHVVSGEAEAGKSWLLLAAAADELRQERGVIWIDGDEMGPGALLERLRSLDPYKSRISELFAYLRPAEPLSDTAREHVERLLFERDARLVVFDAFNPALALHGYDPNSSRDVEDFFRRVVDPFTALGAAVVLADHVVKQRENRGKYAYGSERKQSGAEVHLGLSAIEPFGRGKTGKAKLSVHKDRPGFLERPSPGLFVLASDADSGRCSWRIEPDPGGASEDGFRPTALMERVSRALEIAGEPRSRKQLETEVKGKTDYIRLAVDVLVSEGFAVELPGEHGARLVKLERPFREADEWGES